MENFVFHKKRYIEPIALGSHRPSELYLSTSVFWTVVQKSFSTKKEEARRDQKEELCMKTDMKLNCQHNPVTLSLLTSTLQVQHGLTTLKRYGCCLETQNGCIALIKLKSRIKINYSPQYQGIATNILLYFLPGCFCTYILLQL